MSAHLTLLPKSRLIQRIEAAERRARQAAELADYWRGVTNGLIATAPKPEFAPSPETTLAEARRILRSLPVDPEAQRHRDDLLAALPTGGNFRRPGPRCQRDGCDRLLRDGLCGSHDWVEAKARRSA